MPADVQRDTADIPRTLGRPKATDVACPLTTPTGGRIWLLARSVCAEWGGKSCVQLVQVEREQG